MSKSEVRDIDHGWRDLMDRVKLLRGGIHVKVGVLSDEGSGGLHEKDAEGKALPLTVAEIAAVQEFGTKDGKIPSRSFIRSTFDEMRAELQKDLEKLAARVIFGEITAEQAFNILGLKLATAIKKKVTTGPEIQPTNAESTKERKEAKGSGGRWGVRTLIDTGRMIGAVTWAVIVDGVKRAGGGKGKE